LAVQRVLTKQGFHCPPHYVVKVDWTSLAQLPWSPGQLHLMENYWEAAGVMAAMQAGIDPKAVRRPLERAIVEKPTGATPGIAEILTAPLRPF
ncbi:MAG: hypothetical protein IIC33_09225, partial [Chloroflexi bacterium]|nr:hypothetical protein [Chloroflexota bacterium]